MNPFRYINELHLEVTPHCNMQCVYCYLGNKPSSQDKPQYMDNGTAIDSLKSVIGKTESDYILITFHGGEPMLQDPEWFEIFCGTTEALAGEKGVTIRFSMQSNATLLNQRLLDVIIRHRIMVGVSIDGLEEVHNKTRGLFNLTINNAIILNNERLLGGIIAVITRENICGVNDFMSYLTSIGIRKVSFNDYYATGRGNREIAPSADEIYSVWSDILDYMLDSNASDSRDRLMMMRVDRFLNPPDSDYYNTILNCRNPYCHAGITMIHVGHNGDIFPCGSSAWANMDLYRLGNIKVPVDEDRWKNNIMILHKKSEEYFEKCPSCFAASICGYGCSAFEKNDPEQKHVICAATRMFYSHLETIDRNLLHGLLDSSRDLQVRI